MDTVRKVGLVGLGVVFFVFLVSANAAVALDRTALDSEFAKDKADETGLYGTLAEEVPNRAGDSGANSESELPLDRSREELLAAAITDEYVRSQGEKNIDAVYTYLHGETNEIRLEFATGPLENRLLTEIENDVRPVDFEAIDMPFGAEIETMASSESAFENRRTEFRAEQKDRIQTNTERELTDEELEAQLEASMDDIRDDMLAEMDAQLEDEFEGEGSELEPPIRKLQTARIDALTGESTYEEFTNTVETTRPDLGDAIVNEAESELDGEFPETVDLTEEVDQQGVEALETARTGVSILSTLSLVLPAFALVIAGGIGYLAPRSIAALEIGAVSLVTGVFGVIGSTVAAGQFRSAIDPANAPPGMGEFLLALVTGTLHAVTWQSVFLVIVGTVAVGVGAAIRLDYV